MSAYVHGYSRREAARLRDQAATLERLLHADSVFPPGHTVLEAGCGTGAQTVILARKNPDVSFISMDVSARSLASARGKARRSGLRNVRFVQGDLFSPPFENSRFDHVFVCFVLEHLADPVAGLAALRRVLKENGTLTVIEGDHGSTFFHPRCAAAEKAVSCLSALQKSAGGNARIGRELYPLLNAAGFRDPVVTPKQVYADAGKPDLVRGFIRDTFVPMVESIGPRALAAGLIGRDEWDRGLRGLYRTAEPDGSFCYTFFKGTAVR